MEDIEIKIVNKSDNPLPVYETPSSAGMDVRANLPEASVVLKPGERMLVPTGLSIQLPRGHECQVRPRSGLALKHGITVLNTPGTVDADYRGEIGIILINLGQEPFVVNHGDRIAQLVITDYVHAKWIPAKELDRTKRGDGAFGHTGVD